MRRVRALVLALLLLALTGGSAVRDADAWWFGAEDVGSQTELRVGWRWESYGGLEVGVPGDWGWDDSTMRLDAWCIGPDNMVKQAAVGRPGGIVPAMDCGDHEGLVSNLGWLVGFGDAPGQPDGVDHERDTSTVRLDGVEVVIAAPAVLRKLIAATIHRVRTDSSGCPVTHAITGQPRLRPTPPVAVTALRAVAAVSACRYRLYDASAPSSAPRLFSSLRLEGAAAEAAIQQITRVPLGGGPNHPDQCVPEAADGSYGMVLRVRSAAGLTEIMVRFSGCDHNGFDDGATVRTLTPAALAPLRTGPNDMISGEHLLW